MSAKLLAILSLCVTLLGNVGTFGVFLIHCRRDKREFSKRPVTEVPR